MVLPSSGIIYLSQVNTELGKATTTAISLGQADVRQLFQVAAGATISLSQGYGKGVSASQADWGPQANFNFTIPWYNNLYVEVRGAGGGGAGGAGSRTEPRPVTEANPSGADAVIYSRGNPGGTGGASAFYSSTALIGYGGGGGTCNAPFSESIGPTGVAGTASGGSYNAQGGGSGGGGGGGSAYEATGGNGGAGGVAAINFSRGAAGAPVPYTAYTIQVGSGGGGGARGGNGGANGGAGAGGYVLVRWS